MRGFHGFLLLRLETYPIDLSSNQGNLRSSERTCSDGHEFGYKMI